MAGYSVVIIAFVFSCTTFTIGLDCTNRCCYYYHVVPKNVTTISCNLEGRTIHWVCQIYTPHQDNTNLSVQWYRAAIETVASAQLISEMGGKYDFASRFLSAVNDSQSTLNGLFLDEFVFTIHNFNSSIDDGHYWCQIVVNDSCPLEPSPRGLLALSQFPVTKCAYNSVDFNEYEMEPICAEGTPCIKETITAELTTPVIPTYHNIHSITVVNADSILLYGVIGGLLFIILLLLLIIIVCTVCNIRYHKMYKTKQSESNNDTLEMDTPGPVTIGIFTNGTTYPSQAGESAQPVVPPLSDEAPLPTPQEPTTSTVHEPTSRDDEVKYALPGAMYRPSLRPQEVSSSSVSSQYQGLRASRVDVISAYNVPNARKQRHGDPKVKVDPQYANLPM